MQEMHMFQTFNMEETGDPYRPIIARCRIRDKRQIGDWDEGWTLAALSRDEVIETYEFLKKFLGV